MSKLSINKAMKQVEVTQIALAEAQDSYFTEADTAKAEVSELEEQLESAQHSKLTADSIDKAKKATQAVRDLEEQLDFQKTVNNTRRKNNADRVVETAEKAMKAHTEATSAYHSYVEELKRSVSLETLEQDNKELKAVEKQINDAHGYIKSVLLEIGVIDRGVNLYRAKGLQFHVNKTDLYNNLETVFNKELVYKQKYNRQ